jgi:beta-galactosidase
MHLAAGEDTLMHIKPFLAKVNSDSEYLLNLIFTLSKDQSWAPAGHIIASNQFALTTIPKLKSVKKDYTRINMYENDSIFKLTGAHFEISFNKHKGILDSYIWNGEEQILTPLIPDFSRPLTDNDERGWRPHRRLRQWYNPALKLTHFTTDKQKEGWVRVKSGYSLIKNSCQLNLNYQINGDGVIKVDYSLLADTALPNLPKVGMQVGIKQDYQEIFWYGRGPWENYIDRRYGSDAGIYNLPIHQFMEPYVMPQENANRTDVRWMLLSDSEDGLLIVADSLLSMSAWPYTEENINRAKHTNELKEANHVTLNIDLVQMGVGGNTSWLDYAQPLEKYQIPAGNYFYSFYLLPLKNTGENLTEIVRKVKF